MNMPTRHRLMLPLLMACAVLVVGQLYVTLPLVATIAGHFGVSPAAAGWAGSAFGLAYAAGFLVFGSLSDHYGRRSVLLLGLLATGAATVLVGLADSLPLLLGSRALQGFAAASFPPTALALISETLPQDRRPLGISFISLAFLGAAPLAQLLGAQAVGGGWQPMMLALAPAYLVAALALAAVLKGQPSSKPPAGTAGTTVSRPTARSPWKQQSLWAPWAAAATVLFAFVLFHAGLPLVPDAARLDLQTLRLVGLPPMLATFAAAPLARRFGPASTAGTGLALGALALLIGLAGNAPAWTAASVLLSAGVAIAVPGLIGTVVARAAPSVRARALAIYSFVLFLGASAAAPLAPPLAHHSLWALLGLPAFALAAAAWLVAVLRPLPFINPLPERNP